MGIESLARSHDLTAVAVRLSEALDACAVIATECPVELKHRALTTDALLRVDSARGGVDDRHRASVIDRLFDLQERSGGALTLAPVEPFQSESDVTLARCLVDVRRVGDVASALATLGG